MGHQVVVCAGEVEFLAEVVDGGPSPVGLDQVLSFDGIRDTVRAIAEELTAAWEGVKPSQATVEFTLSLTARTGKLAGLLVEGGGQGSLKVTLSWRRDHG